MRTFYRSLTPSLKILINGALLMGVLTLLAFLLSLLCP